MRVAVASRSFSRHPVLRAELQRKYPDVTFNDTGKVFAGDELVSFLSAHERAIVALERIDDALLARLPGLKVLSKYGVGVDSLDLPALAQRGVRLGWRAGVNRRAVSELVIAFMISLLRRMPQVTEEVRRGGWSQPGGRQLSQCVVGIIGCGHVGKDLVALLGGFGPTILVHDIREFPEFYAQNRMRAVSLETLLRESDIVTLHVPLDSSTRLLLDAERLAWMRQGAILINAARGGLVDETAAKIMLQTGRLGGAAFDVFAGEPPSDLELVRLPNFIGTAHIGGSTEEAILAMGRAAIDGLETARVPDAAFRSETGLQA
jgi:phosphoglycerate dehydrogenase-like enzyme